MSGLSGDDRCRIEEARQIARVRFGEIRTFTGDDDLAAACAVAFGRAQWALNDLLRLVERLDGGEDQAAGDIQRLDRIRVVLAKFDWEHDDRQYALEAIERIVSEGETTMKVNTGAFRTLTEQVAALHAEVAGLRHMVAGESAEGQALRDALVRLGREVERQERAERAARRRPQRPRPRYLQVLGGGAS